MLHETEIRQGARQLIAEGFAKGQGHLSEAGADKLRAALSELRAAYLVHQHAHWTVAGPEFYAAHQMFERLYGMAQKAADELAERLVGLSGSKALDLAESARSIATIVAQCTSEGDRMLWALTVERRGLIALKEARTTLRDAGELSDGLDDLLMGLASDREQAMYLLRQAGS